MTKSEQRAETEALVRKARYGKAKLAITRCPEFERRRYRTATRGGMMPAHLDPRKL